MNSKIKRSILLIFGWWMFFILGFFSKGNPGLGKFKEYQEWDSWTAKFSGGANIPFLMLQLPQIILNTQNLLAGNNTALSAVPWLVMKDIILHRSVFSTGNLVDVIDRI